MPQTRLRARALLPAPQGSIGPAAAPLPRTDPTRSGAAQELSSVCGDLWHIALARAASGEGRKGGGPGQAAGLWDRPAAARADGCDWVSGAERGAVRGAAGSRGEPGSWHRTGNLSVISARLSTQISSCATPGTWIYMKVSLLITIPVGGLVHPVSQKNKGVDSQTQVDESRKAELVTPRLFLALPLPRPAWQSCMASCSARPQPSAVQTPHRSHTGVWHRDPAGPAATPCSASRPPRDARPALTKQDQPLFAMEHPNRCFAPPWESRPLTRQHISGQWWVPVPTAFGVARAATWEALGTRHPHVLLQSQNFHF